MHITITGAAGRVGRVAAACLASDHDLSLIDYVPVGTEPSIVADLSVPISPDQDDSVTHALQHSDVLIHLAEDPWPKSPWERVLQNNIGATWNITRLAASCNVRRIIYASSHWAVKGLEEELAPAYRMPDGRKIGPDAPFHPRTYYGLGKICGELTGKMMIESGDIESFVAVRIGYYDPEPFDAEHHRVFGITRTDLESLFLRSVEADFSGFHVVYGVSQQSCGPFDLSNADDVMGWVPTEVVL
jgi:nucleoside-diphosphate-sugar epimerase